MPQQRGIDACPFPTTHWSLVGRAAHQSEDVKRQALADLLKRYLPAMRSHLVLRRRIPADRADDLLQNFVLDKVLLKELISKADQARGKFRSFLLVALNHYIMNLDRNEHAAVRAPAVMHSLDEKIDTPSRDIKPDQQFDIEWARQVLREVLARMQMECHGTGRDDIWQIFEARILLPTLGQAEPLPYEQLVERFGLSSPAQASNLLITGKRMFARTLRMVIGEYEKDPQDIEAEIEELYRALGGG